MSQIFANYKTLIDGKVPYTGASANVDLGSFGVTANYFNLDANSSFQPESVLTAGGARLKSAGVLRIGCLNAGNNQIGGMIRAFPDSYATGGFGGALDLLAGTNTTASAGGSIFLSNTLSGVQQQLARFNDNGFGLYSTNASDYFLIEAGRGTFEFLNNCSISGIASDSIYQSLLQMTSADLSSPYNFIQASDAFASTILNLDDAGQMYISGGFSTGGSITAVNQPSSLISLTCGDLFNLINDTNLGTNNVIEIFKIRRNRGAGSAPAANYGFDVNYYLKSNNVNDRLVATDNVYWVTATDASRSPRRDFKMTDNSATSTCLSMQASSGSPQLGFYSTAPIARPTTASGASAFTANAGTAVNDASTFDGYTLKQVVKALRDLGLLT